MDEEIKEGEGNTFTKRQQDMDRVFTEMTEKLSCALVGFVNSLNPQKIIIGHEGYWIPDPYLCKIEKLVNERHTAILAKWKPVFEFIPIESRIEKFQDEYYDAIARCHVSGESTIFIEFMLSQIDRILEDISLQMNEENEQFSETVRKMLEIMEYDTPYTRKTLMEKLGLKSRDGFRRNYLQPALEMNLIQMTLPDKPNSRKLI